MYSRQILTVFFALVLQNSAGAQDVPPEFQSLSAQCKETLKNPKGSPECSPQAVLTGGPDVFAKMCQNPTRCAEENRKAIREGCAADANSDIIKRIVGPNLDVSLQTACIKDASGEFCALKARNATSEQNAKQSICGECHEKVVVVLKNAAERNQEGREALLQASQEMSKFCGSGGNLTKRAEQASPVVDRPQQMSNGPTLHSVMFLGSIAMVVSLGISLLIQV
jgi:hypothetical protein